MGVAQIHSGQRVLIQRAAGGVGHLAVQIAKARGAHVIGVASAAKHDFLRQLGADEAIDYATADLAAEAGTFDVVLDLLGGEHAERSAAALAPDGLLISAVLHDIGITAERAAQLGVRLGEVSVRPSAHDLSELVALIRSGRLNVHVNHAVALADVATAHELSASGHTTGKIVLLT